MTENTEDTTAELESKIEQQDERIDKLESTLQKMMPSRRDMLKMGGAGVLGATLYGSATAGAAADQHAGDVGSPDQRLDMYGNHGDFVSLGTEEANITEKLSVDLQDLDEFIEEAYLSWKSKSGTQEITRGFGKQETVVDGGESVVIEDLRRQQAPVADGAEVTVVGKNPGEPSTRFIDKIHYHPANTPVVYGSLSRGDAPDRSYSESSSRLELAISNLGAGDSIDVAVSANHYALEG